MCIKLGVFSPFLVVSKAASASIMSAIVKETTVFFDPIIAKLSAFFTNHILNNYPNIGYWALGVIIFGISLLFLYSDKDDPFIKFVIIDRVVGVALTATAIYVVLQPYVGPKKGTVPF